jgi:hypothetical protein
LNGAARSTTRSKGGVQRQAFEYVLPSEGVTCLAKPICLLPLPAKVPLTVELGSRWRRMLVSILGR